MDLVHVVAMLVAVGFLREGSSSSANWKEFVNPKMAVPEILTMSLKFEGSSDLVKLKYHMGPVLSYSPINIYIIWYGRWPEAQRLIIKDFLRSLSDSASSPSPSMAQWWSTVSLYSDQTSSNVSRTLNVAGEYSNAHYSNGKTLSRLDIQRVIRYSVKAASFPVDHRSGIYLVLTSQDVIVEDFCKAVCGFHYFTFSSIFGYTIPYAWIGNSAKLCPDVCAYPFSVPSYMAGSGISPLAPPNGDLGVDGMISVIAHELAELSSNPLINAWYAGEDPIAPTEIADLCLGIYGTGGGGGYIGQVSMGEDGKSFNLFGLNSRRFLVQWIWSPILKACRGPNALD